MQNLDVYEVYRDGDLSFGGIPPEEYKGNYFVRKLPMKSDIDFHKFYGEHGDNNWWHDRLPVIEENNKLKWDY